MKKDIALVVDDESLTAEAIRSYLAKTSKIFRYVVSKSGAEEAFKFLPELQDFENAEFRLLITDFNLGKSQWIKNGVELARLIEDLYPDIKVIVMSSSRKARDECKKYGYHFLHKPFSLVGLKDAVDTVMRAPHPARDE